MPDYYNDKARNYSAGTNQEQKLNTYSLFSFCGTHLFFEVSKETIGEHYSHIVSSSTLVLDVS